MMAVRDDGGRVQMTRAARKRATILVADDDAAMLRMTALILDRSGYEVLTARDGEAALKAFGESQHAIQLVISDVVMPGIKGPQLVRFIKGMAPSTATLLMSGTYPMACEGSDVRLIGKPFTRDTLLTTVRDLLAACDFAKVEREQSMARSQRLSSLIAMRFEEMS